MFTMTFIGRREGYKEGHEENVVGGGGRVDLYLQEESMEWTRKQEKHVEC